MTGLVLLWCMAQAPQAAAPVAVVVSSKRPNADVYAATAAARVHAALIREGVRASDALDDVATARKVKAAGYSDARSCQGGANCLVRLALLLGPNAVVVGVDVGKMGSQLALRLEAVSAQTGKTLLVADVPAPIDGWGDKVAVPITLFARQLIEKLATLAPPAPTPPAPTPPVAVTPPEVIKALPDDLVPPVVDAPLIANLTPPPVPPLEVKSSRPAALKWTFGIGAVAGAGVSLAFLGAGLSTRAEFNGSNTMVDQMKATFHTAAQAEVLARRSNSQFTISLVAGAVAAALTTVAIYLFVTE